MCCVHWSQGKASASTKEQHSFSVLRASLTSVCSYYSRQGVLRYDMYHNLRSRLRTIGVLLQERCCIVEYYFVVKVSEVITIDAFRTIGTHQDELRKYWFGSFDLTKWGWGTRWGVTSGVGGKPGFVRWFIPSQHFVPVQAMFNHGSTVGPPLGCEFPCP